MSPFWKRDRSRPETPAADPVAEDAAGEELDAPDDDEVATEDTEDADERARFALRERAAALIPGGTSTGSKRPEALYGGADEPGPGHYIRAHGCRLTTPDMATYIDCSMALGAVALGYADEVVAEAVAEAARAGNVTGLPDVREVEVAARLVEVIPCAEQVRFLKTGAEAVAAAVRIARTATGRMRVVRCGYFGWLDWASDAAGVPAGARADSVEVPFDDVQALERAVADAGGDLAAIVLEPVVERLPSEEWVRRAREICDEKGAVLVFDEIKTGFRLAIGGYQQYAGITPDLATFGKAMANGFPLSAVVGKAAVMEAAARTWISSTLAAESTGLAAAGAVLEWHARAEVCEALWSTGREMREAVQMAIDASGAEGVRIEGLDPMWMLRFDDPADERRFLALARGEGVLFKRGAYNYASLAHDEEAIAAIERAASTALVALRDGEP